MQRKKVQIKTWRVKNAHKNAKIERQNKNVKVKSSETFHHEKLLFTKQFFFLVLTVNFYSKLCYNFEKVKKIFKLFCWYLSFNKEEYEQKQLNHSRNFKFLLLEVQKLDQRIPWLTLWNWRVWRVEPFHQQEEQPKVFTLLPLTERAPVETCHRQWSYSSLLLPTLVKSAEYKIQSKKWRVKSAFKKCRVISAKYKQRVNSAD